MRTEEEIKQRGKQYTEWLKNVQGITKYVLEEKIGELKWILNHFYEPKIVSHFVFALCFQFDTMNLAVDSEALFKRVSIM